MSVELTILMPCLNEAETLAVCIRKAMGYLRSAGVSGEVLVADNGSTDGSQAIAIQEGARVVSVAARGYGAALIDGIKSAKGEYVIMGDADDSYDFSSLSPFLERLRAGADLVMGNRFQGGIEKHAMPFLHKYLGNPVLSWLGRLFFRIRIGDFHCGLRGFRRTRIVELGLRSTGMEFASEMVVRATLAGYHIEEVPTTLSKDGRSRPPHLRSWRDGWRHLKFLLMYSPRWLFLIPGLFMLTLGVTSGTILFFSSLHVNRVVFDLNTFIASCFLTVVGSQLLTVFAVARQYATATGFLPHSRKAEALGRYFTTDRIALLGAIVVLLGFVLFVTALSAWANVNFGDLSDPHVHRAVVAGLTIIVIGLQLLIGAFLVGILKIPHI
jgi:glycosyltransferase involved in cell wall biosynthesis